MIKFNVHIDGEPAPDVTWSFNDGGIGQSKAQISGEKNVNGRREVPSFFMLLSRVRYMVRPLFISHALSTEQVARECVK